MTLNGNDDELNGYNSIIKDGNTASADYVKSVIPPIGSIIAWAKTFDSADSGTTTSTTTDKLVETGQNFETTCSVNMIINNTTDDTWAYITAVDSDTTLSISSDIMASGEEYTIYTTPTLPDGWVECDGSTLSDSDSPYNGATLPDLNSTQRFLRGSDTSGTTGGSDTHTHQQYIDGESNGGANGGPYDGHAHSANTSFDMEIANGSSTPAYYEVVMIMRVK